MLPLRQYLKANVVPKERSQYEAATPQLGNPCSIDRAVPQRWSDAFLLPTHSPTLVDQSQALGSGIVSKDALGIEVHPVNGRHRKVRVRVVDFLGHQDSIPVRLGSDGKQPSSEWIRRGASEREKGFVKTTSDAYCIASRIATLVKKYLVRTHICKFCLAMSRSPSPSLPRFPHVPMPAECNTTFQDGCRHWYCCSK